MFVFFSSTLYVFLVILWGECMPGVLNKNLNYKIGSYGHMYSRIKNIAKVKDVDILFLGSSRAYRGFDTRIFKQRGLKTFNLGSSSQTPIQTELLLERYLSRLNPKLILYEVHPEMFASDGVESSLDIIANDKNDAGSIIMALKQNHMKVYNTLIYGLYRDAFKKNRDFKEKVIKNRDVYVEGGFVEKKINVYAAAKDEGTGMKIKFYDSQLAAFEKSLSLIKILNIPYVLIQTPIIQAKYKTFINTGYFDERMGKYGVYYNFNEILRLSDKAYFYDSRHLNQSGVEFFNTKLIDILFERDDEAGRNNFSG